MTAKKAIWVHGTIVEAEYPWILLREVRRGWGTRFRAMDGQGVFNWFHFPFSTPTKDDGALFKLKKIYLLFRTAHSGIEITNVHIYDGPIREREFNNLSRKGDFSNKITAENTWEIDPPIVISRGLGISVRVSFGGIPGPGKPEREILFTAAGADFDF